MKFCAALKTVLLGLISSRLLILIACGSISSLIQAHDIPSRVTVYAFVKPEGNELTVLLRVPMEALGEVSFPLRGPGFLQFSEAQFALDDAARIYITESLNFYENGEELLEKQLERTRVSLPSNRSFTSYDVALDNITSPPLDDSTDLFWRQGVLDVLVTYSIQSEDSDFSVNPELGTLSDQTTTVLRFLVPNGAERVFNYLGNPGVVEVDPRWHQAALRFIEMGFAYVKFGLERRNTYDLMHSPIIDKGEFPELKEAASAAFDELIKIIAELNPGISDTDLSRQCIRHWAQVHGLVGLVGDTKIDESAGSNAGDAMSIVKKDLRSFLTMALDS